MRKVLVVDDNIPLAENLAEIVTDSDLGDAVVASSGARALELLQRERFDVMITDMRMPGMDGAELIQRARKIDPELPVVVITAYTGDDDLARATREGLLTVFGKPVPTQTLLGFVSSARRSRPVLIVEDDITLADAIAGSLRERGLSTMTANSLSEIERVGGAPSVALVDLRMPGGEHDCASLERVKARFPKVPLVIMTAFRAEMVSLPPVPIVEKPFDTNSLLELVETLSAQPRGVA